MSARIAELEWWKLEIPFRVAFKHAGVSRVVTESMWVEATDALARVGYGESCPRTYVTGETVQTCAAFLADHRDAIIDEIQCVASLRDWVESHTAEIDVAPAAWCAAELAILDLFARQSSSSFESLLDVSPLKDPFQYTAVLGDQSGDAFAAQVAQFSKWGFEDFEN